MIQGKANVIIDGQWGSTGKGKLVGYLALKHDIAVATCDFMSNAGHTYVSDDGKKLVTCQLPTSVVNRDCVLAINAGAAITLDKLFQELEETQCSDRLVIHPHAAIITEEDRAHEQRELKSISSTLKGCGGSLSRKIMRVAHLAKNEPRLKEWIGDTSGLVHNTLRAGGTVLVEGAQGFDLSLNHGMDYPFVTSRDVTTMSILNNAGIPPFYLGDVYGCLRTHPIRVGNTFDGEGKMVGHSGPSYDDQEEISWDELKYRSGAAKDLTELTTVTRKVRRVFTFSNRQIERFVAMCAPTKLFLNFINHVNAEDEGVRTLDELSARSKTFIYSMQAFLSSHFHSLRDVPEPRITHIGTGEKNSDMVEV